MPTRVVRLNVLYHKNVATRISSCRIRLATAFPAVAGLKGGCILKTWGISQLSATAIWVKQTQ